MQCLAIFDWDEKAHCLTILCEIEGLFQACGILPQSFKIIADGKIRSKTISLEELKTSYRDRIDIKSIEGVFARGNDECRFFVSGAAPSARMIFVGGVPFEPELPGLNATITALSRVCSLTYGYSFNWSSYGEPELYALGITQYSKTAPQDGKAEADARWFNERVLNAGNGRYKIGGMLRSVYEMNLLNLTHLNHKVDGHTLGGIIEQEAWGGLVELSNSNWLWKVPQGSVESIFKYLDRRGFII